MFESMVKNMKIKTKYLGDAQIDRTKIIYFKYGLPGFQDETAFVLLNLPGQLSTTFQTLQSVKTNDLAFIVVNPYQFFRNYEFQLDTQTIDQLQITSSKDVTVVSIVTVKKPFEKSTINLQAPIIINVQKMLGKQCILNDETYQTRTPLQTVTKGDR